MSSYTFIIFISFLFMLSGCMFKESKHSINLVPTYSEKPIACFNEVNIDNNNWHVNQLGMYLSDFKVLKADGKWHQVKLSTNQYQSGGVVYLGGLCQKNKASGNWQIEYLGDSLVGKKIQFTLGVPFELNHLNPIKQLSPLNMPSMFWVWRIGHKFLRLEMTSKNNEWLFHLGSLGCKSPSVVRAPTERCLYPNSFDFDVELTSDKANLQFDLANLLSELVIAEEEYCQSEQDVNACQVVFKNLKHKPVFRAD